MKFKKFAKAAMPDGLLFEKSDPTGQYFERWLFDGSAAMRVPPNVKCMNEGTVRTMPGNLKDLIEEETMTDECKLVRAEMPEADGTIKTVRRIFRSEDHKMEIPIYHADWTLLDKSDVTYIVFKYSEDLEAVPLAIQVLQYPKNPADEPEVVGIILPVED